MFGIDNFSIEDFDQNDKISRLEREVSILKRKINGGDSMNEMIKGLKGHFVEIDCGLGKKAKLVDCDDEWIKFEETDKKGVSKISLIRISDISEIKVLD